MRRRPTGQRGAHGFALALLLVLGCARESELRTPEPRRREETPRAGGTLHVPIPNARISLNPLQGKHPFQPGLWDCLYPSLLHLESRGPAPPAIELDLARRYDWSRETSVLTIVVRSDRVWEDTTRVGGEDVVASYQTYLREGLLARWPGVSPPAPALLSVAALDDSTVRFQFRPGVASWVALEAVSHPVLPAAWLVKERALSGGAMPSRSPSSAGAFRLPSSPSGRTLALRANPLAPPGHRPWLRRVFFEPCPGSDARVLRLAWGRADVVMDAPLHRLDALFQMAEADPRSRGSSARRIPEIYNVGLAAVEMLIFNHTDPTLTPLLREAITHAIDRERLVKRHLTVRGAPYGGPASGLLEPMGPAPPDTVATAALADSVKRALAERRDAFLLAGPPAQFDPEKARQLLARQGFVDQDRDGYLGRPSVPGDSTSFETPLRLRVLYDRTDEWKELLLASLEEDFFRVGLLLEAVPEDGPSVWRRFQSGEFQIALVGFRAPGTPDLSDLWASWGAWNGGRYSSPEVDDLARRIMVTEDPTEVEWLARELEARVRHDHAAAFLVYRDQVDVLAPRVRGYRNDPGSLGRFLHEIWLADTLDAAVPPETAGAPR